MEHHETALNTPGSRKDETTKLVHDQDFLHRESSYATPINFADSSTPRPPSLDGAVLPTREHQLCIIKEAKRPDQFVAVSAGQTHGVVPVKDPFGLAVRVPGQEDELKELSAGYAC